MIVVFKPNTSKKDETAVLKEIKKLGYKPHVMRGEGSQQIDKVLVH